MTYDYWKGTTWGLKEITATNFSIQFSRGPSNITFLILFYLQSMMVLSFLLSVKLEFSLSKTRLWNAGGQWSVLGLCHRSSEFSVQVSEEHMLSSHSFHLLCTCKHSTTGMTSRAKLRVETPQKTDESSESTPANSENTHTHTTYDPSGLEYGLWCTSIMNNV